MPRDATKSIVPMFTPEASYSVIPHDPIGNGAKKGFALTVPIAFQLTLVAPLGTGIAVWVAPRPVMTIPADEAGNAAISDVQSPSNPVVFLVGTVPVQCPDKHGPTTPGAGAITVEGGGG